MTAESTPTLQQLLPLKALQAKLVELLGDQYRFTAQQIRLWTQRDNDPLPCVRKPGQKKALYHFDLDTVLEWLDRETQRTEAQDAGVTSSKKEGIQVTLRAMAREIDTHVDTLTARIRNWNIRPVDRRTVRGGDVDYYRLRDILDALTASARADDPDMLPAIERDAYYRAELRKDEVRRLRRELIEIDDARAVFHELVAVRRDFYDLLVDVLEQQGGLKPDTLDLVQREIDTVRQREADTIVDLGQRLTATSRPAD